MATGTISLLDETGDSKLMWDHSKPDEVSAAKAHFEALKTKGYAAFKAEGKEGSKGEQIRTFDPYAERIIMVPPIVGG